MFRGFSKSEHNIALILVLAIFGGLAYKSHSSQVRSEVSISGPAAQISATELQAPDDAESVMFSGAVTGGLIDVNKASATLLEELPGIGPSKAGAIITYREQRGGFREVSELTNVPGIGEKTLESLRPLITVTQTDFSAAAPVPQTALGVMPSDTQVVEVPTLVPGAAAVAAEPVINLNTATAEELEQLHRIGPALSQKIIADRIANGPFRTVDEWTRVNGIGPKTLEQNRHRLTVH